MQPMQAYDGDTPRDERASEECRSQNRHMCLAASRRKGGIGETVDGGVSAKMKKQLF